MRKLFIVFLLMVFTQPIFAQELKSSEQTLEFYYIAHDRTTPVGKVCDFIQERAKEATYYKDLAMIFYLANGDNPTIIRMNLKGDNRKDFNLVINGLQQQLSHDINPNSDRRIITELFNDVDFVDEEGNPLYRSFQWISFITPLFWQMGYNEDVLASLYFILDLGSLPSDYLSMDVYYDNDSNFKYNNRKPFGDKELCGQCNILPLL